LRDGTYAEAQAHELIQQVADLALSEVIARSQHAHQRQRAWAQLAFWNACRQHACVQLGAARAATAVQAEFVDQRMHGRHFEDLMALRLIGHFDLSAAFAH
jgi:hypothetical protein